MVRHWARALRAPATTDAERRSIRRKQALNATGAAVTGLVFVIVLVTKFAEGAWIVVLAAPLLFVGMKAVAGHYRQVAEELAAPASGAALPGQIHAVVLVSNLLAPTLRALAFAQATAPATLRAITVSSDDTGDPLAEAWRERGVPVPLVVIESPYRETVRPVLRYVRHLRREHPGDVISIVIPEYVVGHWWQNVLHNQTALRLKARLLFESAGDRHERTVGPGQQTMSVADRITHVLDSDLLDEQPPARRAPAGGVGARRRLAGVAVAVVGLPLLTLLLDGTRGSLTLESQAMIYLLAVVAVAVVGGIAVALVTAVVAALLINYFFVAPLHTFDVTQGDQEVALVVFVIVAAVVSGAVELATRRARAAAEASAQADTLTRIAGGDLDETHTLRNVLGPCARDLRHGDRRAQGARPRDRGMGGRRGRGLEPVRRRGAAAFRRRARPPPAHDWPRPGAVRRGPADPAGVRRRGADRLRGAPADRGGPRRPHAGDRRPTADGAARGGRSRPAHAAGGDQGRRQHAAPDRHRVDSRGAGGPARRRSKRRRTG